MNILSQFNKVCTVNNLSGHNVLIFNVDWGMCIRTAEILKSKLFQQKCVILLALVTMATV